MWSGNRDEGYVSLGDEKGLKGADSEQREGNCADYGFEVFSDEDEGV